MSFNQSIYCLQEEQVGSQQDNSTHLLCLGGEVGAILLQGGQLVGARAAATGGCRADRLLALTHHADDLRPHLLGMGE